jgi:hypothetical protein
VDVLHEVSVSSRRHHDDVFGIDLAPALIDEPDVHGGAAAEDFVGTAELRYRSSPESRRKVAAGGSMRQLNV